MRPGDGQNRSIGRHERQAVERTLRAVGEVRSILDVGAGNGRWLSTLAVKKASLRVSLDLSKETLLTNREAAAKTPKFAAVCGDVGALPVAPQSFDLVFCIELMPYVRRSGRLRALREMRRVSNRWIIVQYAHREGLGLLWQRVRRVVGLEATFPRNHLSRSEIEGELRGAGLGVRGFARVGGMFSRSWVVLAESPSADWLGE